jgi:hypothetical protein
MSALMNGEAHSHQNPADVLFGCRLDDMDIGNALRTGILHRCFSCSRRTTADARDLWNNIERKTSVTHELVTGPDYMGPVYACSYCSKFPKKRAYTKRQEYLIKT